MLPAISGWVHVKERSGRSSPSAPAVHRSTRAFPRLFRYCARSGSSGAASRTADSNESTARLCGVPIERWKVAIYTVAGLLTGWAGVLT